MRLPRSLILKPRRNAIAGATIAVGFAAAFVIFLTATPPPANPLGDQADVSKKYLREMEVYGGQANVIAGDFRQWFESLWHGKSLAFTVAFLSVLLALLLFIAFTPLPGDGDPDDTGEHQPDRLDS